MFHAGHVMRFGAPSAFCCLLLALGAGAQEPLPPPAETVAPVVVHGRTLFDIAAPDGSAPAKDRAKAVAAILTETLERAGDDAPLSVSVHPVPAAIDTPASFSLEVGGRELLRVGSEDAKPSGLPPAVFAQALASKIEAALAHERHRFALQKLLQSISLTVLLGLLSFLALRRVAAAGENLRARVEERLSRLQGLHLRQLQLLSSETLQGASYAALGVARLALQLGIAYAYVAFALSQFPGTRPWVTPVTHAFTAPFLSLVERVVRLVPGLVLLVAAAFLLRGALRLSGFLLDRVASGEFTWRWLPKDLAPAVRPLVRGVLVLLALLAVGPLLGTGSDGLLARLGEWAVAAIAIGLVPLLAAASLGSLALLGRRYKLGEWVAVGPHVGEVTDVGFFDVTIVPQAAGRIRIPHLVTLWTAVQHLPAPAAPLEPPAAPKP
jgi:small-conductance mechanosensitive channel